MLNSDMENTHTNSFDNHFKLELVYRAFKNSKGEITSVSDFEKMFNDCLDIDG